MMSFPDRAQRRRGTALGVLLTLGAAACGPSDPQPRADGSSTTTASSLPASTTTVSLAPTSTPEDILCGEELPVFPTISIVDSPTVDTEGISGPSEGADPALNNQVVRHWDGDSGISVEVRWPAGPGPIVDSPIVLTQLVETGSPSPCDVVRVSGYGDEAPLGDVFELFVESLDGIGAKPAFAQDQLDRITPAQAADAGACDNPVITTLEDGSPNLTAVDELLENYAEDRTNGFGYEACFTVAGLNELEILLADDGYPDIVRPSAAYPDSAEALATYLDADPLRVVRESLELVELPEGDAVRLLFGGLTTGPDSNVGEREAVAFIDEFLILLADGDYEAAAGYLSNEGTSQDILDAMPTFEDEPAEALRRYCRSAICASTYKISDTIEFDASTRLIDVAFFTEDETLEYPILVGVFEGQLVLLSPPPMPSAG